MAASLTPIKTRESAPSSDDGRTKPQFAELIRRFANRTKETSVYSGEHFRFLSDFLDSSRSWRSYRESVSLPSQPFAPVHLVINKQRNPRSQSPSGFSIVAVSADGDLESTLSKHAPGAQESLLVFLSGWQSADWLRVIGAQCGVDPELLRRHLSFLETRDFFDQPCLPSSLLSAWRLRTVTIYVRKTALSPDQVHRRRRTDPSDIRNYLHKLRSIQPMGTSIVRQHLIIDETTSAIIQDVSLCVHEKKTGGWVGTAWFDSGRPFYPESAPWSAATTNPGTEDGDPYVPLVLHRPKIALSLSPLGSSTISFSASKLPPRPSFSYLPSQYGSSLSSHLARVDALYAFSELIALAATTENQFLNLIQARIDVALGSYRGIEALTIENLQYLTILLKDLIERSEEVIYLLENEVHSNWPRAIELADLQSRETARKLLLDDYRWILQRGKGAKEKVQDSIAFINTDAKARASQRSVEQAQRNSHVALLAYFFLPLALTTSIFGMNFVQFDSVKWGICSVVIALFLIMMLSLVLCFWDSMSNTQPATEDNLDN